MQAFQREDQLGHTRIGHNDLPHTPSLGIYSTLLYYGMAGENDAQAYVLLTSHTPLYLPPGCLFLEQR